MIRSAIILAALAAFATAPAYAADAPARTAPQAKPAPAVQADEAQAQFSPSSPTLRDQCSRENPFIEYRDCVNASTRNPNAKVRMG